MMKNRFFTLLLIMVSPTSLWGQTNLDSVLYVTDSVFSTPEEALKLVQKDLPNFTSKYTLVVRNLEGEKKNVMQHYDYDFPLFLLKKGDSIWLFFPDGEKRYFTYSNNISYTCRAEKMQNENVYIDVNFDSSKDTFFNPCGIEAKLDNGDATKWKVAAYRFAKTTYVDSTDNFVRTTLKSHKEINVSPNTFEQLKFLYVTLPSEAQRVFGDKHPIGLLTDPESLRRLLIGRSF